MWPFINLYTMKKLLVLLALVPMLFSSCSSTQSLQEYFVDNSENPNFLQLDLPASILKIETDSLDEDQRDALNSLRKLNILAFRITDSNREEYATETQTVKEILKNEDFNELMKIRTSYGNGVVKYLGDDDAIDEVVIFGSNDDEGFALIRVLGKNMNPAHLVPFLQAMQKSDYKGEELGKVAEFLKG